MIWAAVAHKEGDRMSDAQPLRQTLIWQRVENGFIALAIVFAVLAWGQPWWMLLALFLVFDLSALGYLVNPRVGAFFYNLVHNYTGPAVALALWAAAQGADVDATWLAMLAAAWGFHVAVDRTLGYGLKLGAFNHTHLGTIGKVDPPTTSTDPT